MFLQRILFVFVIFQTVLSFGQTTAIPDENFEQALIDQGIDLIPVINGGVQTSWISGIVLLNVASSYITDMTGIEDFSSLRGLECSYNNLDTLNLLSNDELEVLVAHNSHINNLKLGDKPALYQLGFSHNDLTSLDLSLVPSLEYFDCSHNALESLNLDNCSNLEWLDFSYNHIETIDLTYNINLWRIECDENELELINVDTQELLSHLICRSNNISFLDVSSNPNLEELYCQYNEIDTLLLGEKPNLRELECNNNHISNLDLESAESLTILYCEHNQLTQLNLINNSNLEDFIFTDNALLWVDLKNGSNETLYNFYGVNNPELNCFNVDNAPYSAANWTLIDDVSVYSEECFTDINQDLLAKQVNVYPNPVNEYVTINIPEVLPGYRISVYSAMGKEVKLIAANVQNELNDLQSGIYYLIVLNENSEIVFSEKLIKIHR
jgi:Leucine-rich repeat (LRR) protein